MEVKTKRSVSALSRRVERFIPVNWGKSELSRFFEATEQQSFATYATFPAWVQALEAIDNSLVVPAGDFFHEIDSDRRTSCRLYMRAFATFRAAARLAVSGQLFEATVLIRSILESSVYGWSCAFSQSHRSAWENRSVGLTEKKAARTAFTWNGQMAMLNGVCAELAVRVDAMYQQVIDGGAHPNVDGVLLSSEVTESAGGKLEISTIFMHGEEAVLMGILDLLRAMQLCYELLDLSIHDRLRILGIDAHVADQNRRVLALIESLEQTLGA